jgi:hypothetical protein
MSEYRVTLIFATEEDRNTCLSILENALENGEIEDAFECRIAEVLDD